MDRKVSITAHRQGDSKELANSSHTLPCCLSKLRSRVEAAWKQVRSSLEYGYSMESVPLYPSFGAPLVFLLPPYDGSEMARRWLGVGSKKVRRRFEDAHSNRI